MYTIEYIYIYNKYHINNFKTIDYNIIIISLII